MKTFTLAYPVTAPDGTVITEISLRRLKVKEMKTVDPQVADGKMGAILKYVAVMAGVPNAVMEELDGGDALALLDEAASFLDRGTGAKPSA